MQHESPDDDSQSSCDMIDDMIEGEIDNEDEEEEE